VINDKIPAPLWGPELKILVVKYAKGFERKFIYEYDLDHVLCYLVHEDMQHMFQAKLLHHCSADTVLALYEDYIEHCFPSFYMTLESLKQYLVKYGFDKGDTRFAALFRDATYKKRGPSVKRKLEATRTNRSSISW